MEVLKKKSETLGKVLVPALVAAVFAALLTGCGSDDQPGELNGITRDPPASTKGLALPDLSPGSDGNTIPIRGPKDGMMLLYFGYTSCPDVCPTSMADLRLALAELTPEQRERVSVSMVTVDPDRDTGTVLNDYLGYFFEPGEFHSLRTENPRRLAAVERAFGATHKLGEPDAEGNYEVGHSAQIFAIDDQGTVKVEWAFQTDPERIADDLKTLLEGDLKPDA